MKSVAFGAVKAVVTTGTIGAISSLPALPLESDLRITICVYNVAQVPSGILKSAERSAAEVFERSGIVTNWFEPHSGSRGGARVQTNVYVRIYTRPMLNAVRLGKGVLGFVLRFDGNSVAILYDRVQALASWKRVDITAILGIAMAHEIGHLLLRSREHCSEGIMRGNWSSTDLQAGAQGSLHFTLEQAQNMRCEVLRWNHPPGESARDLPDSGLNEDR